MPGAPSGTRGRGRRTRPRLDQVDRENGRYELTVEVEGGSLRDAMDAADELLLDYENALGVYHPKLLAGIAPEPR